MSRITKNEESMRVERRRSPVAGFGFAQPAGFCCFTSRVLLFHQRGFVVSPAGFGLD